MAKVVKGVVSVIGAVASVLAVIPSPIQPIAAVVATVASVASTALNMIAPTKPKSSAQGQQTSFKLDPQSGIPYVIGRTLTGGNGVHRDTWGTDNQYQGFAIVWSGGGPVQAIEAFQADQTTIGFGAGYNAVGGFKDFMWLSTQLGACPSPALPTPVAGFPGWGAQSKLSGYAAGVWVTKFDKKGKKYSGGLPRPAAIIQGVKVYDPRQDSTYPGGVGPCRPLQEETYVYSENPWLHALTWALGRWQNGVKVMGVGMLLEQIDVASFVDAANIADANNWKAGGVVSSVDDKWEVMKMLAQAGGGQCIRLGARLTALVEAPRVAVATIRESDLVGKASISATQFQRSRINRLVPIYRSEAHGWEQVPADPVSFAVHEAEDGGRRTAETEFVLVQQIKQAAELAGYEIKNSREFGPIDLELKIQWLGIEPGDLVNLDMPSAGLANQPALALTRGIDPGTGNVALSLRSETPTKHAEALGKTTTIAPSPSLVPPDLSIVAAPTVGSWTLAAGIVEGPDGTGLPILVARGATDNPNASHVVFEYRPIVAPQGAMPPAPAIGDIAADSTGAEFVYEAGGWARRWLMQSTQDAGVTLQEFGAVTPQTSYQIAVSYVSRGVLGDRRVLGPVLTGSLVASGFAGAGDLAGVDYVRFGDGTIRTGGGGTATDAGYQTALGTAAAIAGQGALATANDAAWGSQVSGRPVELVDGRIPAALDASGILVTGVREGGGSGTVSVGALMAGMAGTNIARNPEFYNGSLDQWYIYDNSSSGKVTATAIADSGAPNSSGVILRVAYDGTGDPSTLAPGPTPYYGGIHQPLADGGGLSRPGYYARGTTVIMPVIARIPVGREMTYQTNGIGDGGEITALTSMAGTGDWKVYVWRIRLGSTGSFGTTAFLAINGGPNAAFHWDLAKWDQIDISSAQRTFMGPGGLYDEFGVTRYRGDLVTSFGVSSGIAGQGALATQSSVAYGSAYVSGFGPLAATDRVRLGNNNGVANESNAFWITDAMAITSIGTASAIAGQGALATANSADFYSQVANRPYALQSFASGYLYADRAVYEPGVLVTALRPAEVGANVTEARVAAAISGQSQWATYGGLVPGNVAAQVQRLDGDGAIESNWVYRASVGSLGAYWPQEAGANVTESRVASAIAGQGALATRNNVAWGSEVTGRDVYLVDGRIPNGLDDAGRNKMGLRGAGGNVGIAELTGGIMGTNVAINPEFHNGFSMGWQIYDNASSGRVTMGLLADASAPNGSGVIMRVSYDGLGNPGTYPAPGPAPGYGGVVQILQDALNLTGSAASRPGCYARNTYVYWRLWAKIPAGYTIDPASNPIGDGSEFQWMTSNAGTGDWSLYVLRTKVGATGPFGSTGFWHISSGPNVAFHWDIAKFDQIDISSSPRSFLGRGGVARETGGYIFDGDAITSLGVSAAIAGQADWATYSGISTSNMAGRVSRLDSGAGRALDGRLLNSNNNFGLRALSKPPGMSATAQTSTATVDFNSSGILYPDWGGSLSLPSASFPGLSQSTQYYFWRNMPSPDGIGSSYGYSTNLVDALGTGKVYLGQYFTPAAGGGSGGGGGWGGENCVAADAIVRLADGRLVDAAEVKAGDRITVLASSFDGIAEHVVSANLVADADCVRLVTESMIPLTLAINTPMTTKDRGWIIAANASGYEIPVLDAAGFRWEKVLDVEYVGRRPVARIECENGTYAAGDIGGRFILSHNPIYKP